MRNKEAKPSYARTVIAYILLIILAFMCLFFFYILIVNATRNHFEIQKGFSALPGTSLIRNFENVMNDANIPVRSGLVNSLIVSGMSALLVTYFSCLTSYGLYAYDVNLPAQSQAIWTGRFTQFLLRLFTWVSFPLRKHSLLHCFDIFSYNGDAVSSVFRNLPDNGTADNNSVGYLRHIPGLLRG